MQLNLHQTHHEIADFEGIFQYLTGKLNTNQIGVHIFPELFLTGYPISDLVLQKSFCDEYEKFLNDINQWSKNQFKTKENTYLLMGGLKYHYDTFKYPTQIENVVYLLVPGKSLEVVYTKQLLPNYDIYEEKKYFTAGHKSSIITLENKKIGLLICEDMWFSHLHEIDPVEELKEYSRSTNQKLDIVINLSASPFHLGKIETRFNRALEISQFLEAPFVYVNRVGAEDEILFDGNSFAVDGNKVLAVAKSFEADCLSIPFFTYQNPQNENKKKYNQNANSWQTIFTTRLSSDTKKLNSLTDFECQEIVDGIILGISDYALKNNILKFTIALSGGMDSSLVLALLKLMKNKIKLEKEIEIEAVFMPSIYSSSLSYDLASDLCRNLKIRLTSFPIKFLHSAIKNAYTDNFKRELKGLADENIQSRLRGALIYMRSNDVGSIVLNTSNKSEIAVGYSTQYGDSVGALSPLGDLYKSEVFEVAHFINRKYGNLIPEDIITRPPSAELRENQVDSESLPPYERLDPILEAILSGRFSPLDLIKKGHEQKEVSKVYSLITKSEYKRRQFCPIIKLKPKSFGFGYRMPINKKTL